MVVGRNSEAYCATLARAAEYAALFRPTGYMTTSEQVGRAMLAVAKHGYPSPILESADINKVV